MAEPLLELHALDVHYGAIHALRGISILVGQGEIVSLIGANGAGKTTTLRAVSGMLRPSAGQIRYEGAPIAGLRPHRLVARGLCHAPEGRGIFPNLTVETIFTIVQEINKQGVTILLVEQNAHLALQIANHGYVLETGTVVQTGTGTELLRSPEIRKAYLGE